VQDLQLKALENDWQICPDPLGQLKRSLRLSSREKGARESS